MVRSDKSLGFAEKDVRTATELRQPASAKSSLSGLERNHFFLAEGGRSYSDYSQLSGLDHLGDGRSFVWLDYDRDGRLDLIVLNNNAPMLQIYHNEMGISAGKSIAIQLRGGNRRGKADSDWSALDAYGARIEVRLNQKTLFRTWNGGEGLAAQNSDTLTIGVGEAQQIESLQIRWPSGRLQDISAYKVGQDLLIDERDGPFWTPARTNKNGWESSGKGSPFKSMGSFKPRAADSSKALLHCYVTTATWCQACKNGLPQLQIIVNSFSKDEIAFWGLAVDPTDSASMLQAYQTKYQPPYISVPDLLPASRQRIAGLLSEFGAGEQLPSTIITNSAGKVLWVGPGGPTQSRLRRILAELE